METLVRDSIFRFSMGASHLSRWWPEPAVDAPGSRLGRAPRRLRAPEDALSADHRSRSVPVPRARRAAAPRSETRAGPRLPCGRAVPRRALLDVVSRKIAGGNSSKRCGKWRWISSGASYSAMLVTDVEVFWGSSPITMTGVWPVLFEHPHPADAFGSRSNIPRKAYR